MQPSSLKRTKVDNTLAGVNHANEMKTPVSGTLFPDYILSYIGRLIVKSPALTFFFQLRVNWQSVH